MDVSIIIPTYNRLWCLPEAIQSCRNTNCNSEIIIVDDGSNDGTWEWLQAQKDLVLIRQKNQGQTYAINAGSKIAQGTYIRFLDSDDFLEPGIIDKQFELAKATNADLVYSNVNGYDLKTKTITKFPKIQEWDDFMEVQLSNRYGSHFLGMLFRTEFVKLVPRRPDYAMREDRMFLLEYGLLNPKTAFLDECAGYWVQHENQMQGNYLGLKSQVANWQSLNIYKTILSKLEQNNALTQKRKEAISSSLWPIATWIGKNHRKDAEDVYALILSINPDFKIPEHGLLKKGYEIFGFKKMQKILSIRRKIIN